MNKTNQNENTIIAVIIAVFITALVVGGGIYLWQNVGGRNNTQSIEKQIAGLQQSPVNNISNQIQTTSQKTQEESKNKSNREIKNWKTYHNNKYGYSFNHPNQWSLKEVAYKSMMVDGLMIKHIELKSSDNPKEYFYLEIGIKNIKEKNIRLNERTGVGAGDIIKDTLRLGDKYDAKVDLLHVPEIQKTVDIIGEETIIDNEHIAQISFAYFNDDINKNIDILQASEYEIAKNILKTFKFDKEVAIDSIDNIKVERVVREYYEEILRYYKKKLSADFKDELYDPRFSDRFVTENIKDGYKKYDQYLKSNGFTSGDPFICAQDSLDNMSQIKLVLDQHGSTNATMIVKLNPTWSKIYVQLIKQEDGWKIDGIQCPGHSEI